MATYLLVHGAWHNGEAWNRVTPLLSAAGHRVFAPSLTGHGDKAHLLDENVGLDTHVDDIVRLILDEDLTDVVLVGHSYAGLVVSSAANRVPERIAELVYLDAMVPEDGENAIDVLPVTQFLIDRAATTGTPWRIPPMDGSFGVTDPEDQAWLRTLLSDESVLCFQQPARLDNPATAGIPRTHIHCTLGAPERRQPVGQAWELPTGHDCMITMPAELAGLLLKLA
ncbi:alpha/beta fold hydrolase [Actinoplanes sp. NPDC049596]|uniref:alpha/beta hydrolase n=1 Tax=unclassified Actinoplanes TaxID=2626549 RepID=UPI00343CCE8E